MIRNARLLTTKTPKQYDIIIAGGGVAGCTLAKRLAEALSSSTGIPHHKTIHIGLLSAGPPPPPLDGKNNPPNPRAYALSPSSLHTLGDDTVQCLKDCGRFGGVYDKMQIWESDGPGVLHFTRDDLVGRDSLAAGSGSDGECYNEEYGLGAVVEDQALVSALWKNLEKFQKGQIGDMRNCVRIDMITGATVNNINAPLTSGDNDPISITYKNKDESEDQVLHTKLLVGADGGNSFVRSSLGMPTVGFGYDRILWDQFSVSPGAVSKKTMQLQRSLSFEFEKSAIFTSTDSDAAFSEDSLSLGTSLSSTGRLSSGGDAASATDFEGSEPLLSDNEKRTQNLRRLMEAHDARACAPHGSDKGNLKEVNVSSTSNSDKDLLLSSSRHRGKEVQKGGLGAALSSYDRKGPQQEMHLTRRMSSQGQGLMSSGTRVSSPPFSGMTQINESGTRAISPILLPPIIQLQNMDDTGTDAVQGSQQYSSSSENKVFIGSAGRLPHLSHSEMAVTPLYSIVGPSSLTNYDNGRQKISSTSRSPPLNSDLIIGGTRASKKAIAFSPPTSMIRERPSQRRLGWNRQRA